MEGPKHGLKSNSPLCMSLFFSGQLYFNICITINVKNIKYLSATILTDFFAQRYTLWHHRLITEGDVSWLGNNSCALGYTKNMHKTTQTTHNVLCILPYEHLTCNCWYKCVLARNSCNQWQWNYYMSSQYIVWIECPCNWLLSALTLMILTTVSLALPFWAHSTKSHTLDMVLFCGFSL